MVCSISTGLNLQQADYTDANTDANSDTYAYTHTTPTPAAYVPSVYNGEYYDNLDFTNLELSRTDATVNFDWAVRFT